MSTKKVLAALSVLVLVALSAFVAWPLIRPAPHDAAELDRRLAELAGVEDPLAACRAAKPSYHGALDAFDEARRESGDVIDALRERIPNEVDRQTLPAEWPILTENEIPLSVHTALGHLGAWGASASGVSFRGDADLRVDDAMLAADLASIVEPGFGAALGGVRAIADGWDACPHLAGLTLSLSLRVVLARAAVAHRVDRVVGHERLILTEDGVRILFSRALAGEALAIDDGVGDGGSQGAPGALARLRQHRAALALKWAALQAIERIAAAPEGELQATDARLELPRGHRRAAATLMAIDPTETLAAALEHQRNIESLLGWAR